MRTDWAILRLSFVLLVITGFGWAQRGLGSLQITVPNPAMRMGVDPPQALIAKRILIHAPNRAITVSARWYSSNPAVATVGLSTGLVTGIATGTSTITAVSGPFATAKTVVEVVPSSALTSITITSPDTSIAKGLPEQYTAMADFSGTPVDVTPVATWNSTMPAVAPINGAGVARGMAVGGPTTIKASLTLGNTTTDSNTLPLTITTAALQSL